VSAVNYDHCFKTDAEETARNLENLAIKCLMVKEFKIPEALQHQFLI